MDHTPEREHPFRNGTLEPSCRYIAPASAGVLSFQGVRMKLAPPPVTLNEFMSFWIGAIVGAAAGASASAAVITLGLLRSGVL